MAQRRPGRCAAAPLLRSLNLPLRFVGSVLLAWLLLGKGAQFGAAVLPLALWTLAFVAAGAVRLQQNFFGPGAATALARPAAAVTARGGQSRGGR